MNISFLKDSYLQLFDNLKNLQSDFIGLNINPSAIFDFALSQLFVVFLFVSFYYLGFLVRKIFKFSFPEFDFFTDIGLGFITTGTLIAILGLFNLINFASIFSLVLFFFIISIYYFYKKAHLTKVRELVKSIRTPKNIFTLIVILFIALSFIRLLLPEIHEDGYHTDLARLYFSTGTINHEARDPLFVIPYSQLPEMVYIIPISFQLKETARTISFGFYFLIIILLFKYSRVEKLSSYPPFLFASIPIVIRYSSSQYTDFFMIYFFLLSSFLLTLQKRKNLFISGAMYGGVISVKMWTVIFLPIYLLFFLYKKLALNQKLKSIFIFIAGVLLVSLLWEVRSFYLTGSPFSPFLTKELYYIGRPTGVGSDITTIIRQALRFNLLFLFQNAKLIGPVLLLGITICLFKFTYLKKALTLSPLWLFFFTLTILYFFNNFYGRYLFPWLAISTIFIGIGISDFIKNYKFIKLTFIFLSTGVFFYYLVSTILILPYGIGWANKNAYLSRTLILDNVSYYNFNNQFEKFIIKSDLVATYDFASFYYANFNHIDINYIFEKNDKSFDRLKKAGATKLLIKGGDIEWFCKRLSLTNCSDNKTFLLTSYIKVHKIYLYQLK